MTGSLLASATVMSALMMFIGVSILSVSMYEGRASGGLNKGEEALIGAETVLDRARYMLITPASAGGWGDKLTTGPVAESVDRAVDSGHFLTLDGGKVLVQRTGEPLERRVTAIVDPDPGKGKGGRIVQARVLLAAGRSFGADVPIIAGLGGGGSGGAVLSNVTIDAGSSDTYRRSAWFGHDAGLALKDVISFGDLSAHSGVTATGPVRVEQGALITFAEIIGAQHISGDIFPRYAGVEHDARFPEFSFSAGFTEDRFRDDAVLHVPADAVSDDSASAPGVTDICADDQGRMLVSLAGPCNPAAGTPFLDRWGDQLLDGTIFIRGEVRIRGRFTGSWTVFAAPTVDGDPGVIHIGDGAPAGRAGDDLLAARGSNTGSPALPAGVCSDGSQPPIAAAPTSSRAGMTLVAGRVVIDPVDHPCWLNVDIWAGDFAAPEGTVPDAEPAEPPTAITGTIRTLGGIILGDAGRPVDVRPEENSDYRPLGDPGRAASQAKIVSWQEVLPSRARRLKLAGGD